MSPGTNGAAKNGLLDLGDLTPDKRAVCKIQRDGRSEILYGWVDGPRCPGYIKSMIRKVELAYLAVVQTEGPPDEDGNPTTVVKTDPLAYDALKRDKLLAVVDGLEYQEAEVISGNEAHTLAILRALAWLPAEDEPDDPEAEGVTATPPTTPDSSPTSPSSASRRRRR
jgi:hypothetical protein